MGRELGNFIGRFRMWKRPWFPVDFPSLDGLIHLRQVLLKVDPETVAGVPCRVAWDRPKKYSEYTSEELLGIIIVGCLLLTLFMSCFMARNTSKVLQCQHVLFARNVSAQKSGSCSHRFAKLWPSGWPARNFCMSICWIKMLRKMVLAFWLLKKKNSWFMSYVAHNSCFQRIVDFQFTNSKKGY